MSRKIGLAVSDSTRAVAKPARIQCPYCDKTYASQEKLDAHIAEKHADKLGKQ